MQLSILMKAYDALVKDTRILGASVLQEYDEKVRSAALAWWPVIAHRGAVRATAHQRRQARRHRANTRGGDDRLETERAKTVF